MNDAMLLPDFNALYRSQADFERAKQAALGLNTRSEGLQLFSPPSGGNASSFVGSTVSAILREWNATIVSEHEGAIDTLLVTIPSTPNAALMGLSPERLHRHCRTLLHYFRSDVTFVIVAHPDELPMVQGWCDDAGLTRPAEFIESPRFKYTPWAQDPFIVLDSDHGTVLCEGVAFNRYDDMTVADDLVAQAGALALPSYLYLQGGNILGGSDCALVGYDYIATNVGRHGLPTPASVVGAMQELFGTSIVTLGNASPFDYGLRARGVLTGFGWQPIFHIDMYVTRTGVWREGKEVVFLGRPREAKEVLQRRGLTDGRPGCRGYSDVPELDDEVVDSYFAETRTQLERYFSVEELPLWLTYGRPNASRLPRLYPLSWNNALVERRESGSRVLLPNFTSGEYAEGRNQEIRRVLQEAAEGAWCKLGFAVHRTDGIEDLAFDHGSLHCMTKVLRRR